MPGRRANAWVEASPYRTSFRTAYDRPGGVNSQCLAFASGSYCSYSPYDSLWNRAGLKAAPATFPSARAAYGQRRGWLIGITSAAEDRDARFSSAPHVVARSARSPAPRRWSTRLRRPVARRARSTPGRWGQGSGSGRRWGSAQWRWSAEWGRHRRPPARSIRHWSAFAAPGRDRPSLGRTAAPAGPAHRSACGAPDLGRRVNRQAHAINAGQIVRAGPTQCRRPVSRQPSDGGLVGNGNSACACRALDRNRADRTSMPTTSPSLRRPLHLDVSPR